MTDEQAMELGRRAVACRGWRWLPGMAARVRQYVIIRDNPCVSAWTDSWPVRLDDDDHSPGGFRQHAGRDTDGDIEVIGPDLRDPGTVGGLLALVREAWSLPTAVPMFHAAARGTVGGLPGRTGWRAGWAWHEDGDHLAEWRLPGLHGGSIVVCGADSEGEILVAALEIAGQWAAP